MLTGAMTCALAAAWLTGALVLLRLSRSARGGGRRVFRTTLPAPAERVEATLVALLGSSGHYLLSFTERMERVLVGEIRAPGPLDRRPVAALFCSVEDAGDGSSLVQVRLDFGDLIDRARRRTMVVLLVVWPMWTILVGAGTALALARFPHQGPWLVLHGFHATYPLVAILVLAARYQHRRRRIGDAVAASLRAARHTVF